MRYIDSVLSHSPLREECPNTEFSLVRIFLYSDWIRENKDQKIVRILTLFTQCSLTLLRPGFIGLWIFGVSHLIHPCSIIIRDSYWLAIYVVLIHDKRANIKEKWSNDVIIFLNEITNFTKFCHNPMVHIFWKINLSKLKISSLLAWSPKLGNQKINFHQNHNLVTSLVPKWVNF